MELIVGKTVQISLCGFIFGGGFEAFRLLDGYIRWNRLPWQNVDFVPPPAPETFTASRASLSSGASVSFGKNESAVAAQGPLLRTKPVKGGVLPPALPSQSSQSSPPLLSSAPPGSTAASSAIPITRIDAAPLLERLRLYLIAPPSSTTRFGLFLRDRMWPARLFGPPPALFFAGIPQQIQALRTLPIGAQVALLSLREGYLTARVLALCFFSCGALGLLKYGSYEPEALYDFQNDPWSIGAGVGLGVYSFSPTQPRLQRAAFAVAAAGLSAYALPRILPTTREVRLDGERMGAMRQ